MSCTKLEEQQFIYVTIRTYVALVRSKWGASVLTLVQDAILLQCGGLPFLGFSSSLCVASWCQQHTSESTLREDKHVV